MLNVQSGTTREPQAVIFLTIDGESKMAGIKLPKSVMKGATRSDEVNWPSGLTTLPSKFGVTAKDLGYNELEKNIIADRATAGSEKEAKILETALQVFLELMARDIEPRQMVDQAGHKLYIDGLNPTEGTRRKYYTNDLDETIENGPAMEERSRWGVRAGIETNQAQGFEMPKPGHYKQYVADHWNDLFRKLQFRSEVPDYKHMHPSDSREVYAAAVERATSDEGEIRKTLLQWLTPFLKNPKTQWTGEE